MNLVIQGNNIDVLKFIHSNYGGEVVDLVYIDPPFFSQKNYGKKGHLCFSDKFFSRNEYLNFLKERLNILRDLLSKTGSIYVHLDRRVVHYVKILMDSIFGENNFRNEIIWSYKRFSRKSSNCFPHMHDTILFYAKSSENIYNSIEDTVRSSARYEKGYHTVVDNGIKKLLIYDEERAKQSGVNFSKYDNIVYSKVSNTTIGDVWDIPIINPRAKERLGYPTQKPEKLLERIIRASTKEGDVVLDCFCGSGTTGVVASRINRSFILNDVLDCAIETTVNRLKLNDINFNLMKL